MGPRSRRVTNIEQLLRLAATEQAQEDGEPVFFFQKKKQSVAERGADGECRSRGGRTGQGGWPSESSR